MSEARKHRNDQENGDPRTQEEISMDHFYQLVLMHRQTREAWQEEPFPEEAGLDTDLQERLARERKSLLEQKTEKKKSNE